MRYKVRIEGRIFEAEVGNVDARPVVVLIEGERYEVWPELLSPEECAPGEESAAVEPGPASKPAPAPVAAAQTPASSPAEEAARTRPTRRTTGPEAAPAGKVDKVVYAPLPGVVDSVAVRVGDQIAPGDPLCVVEAMKMKNVIRATRAGTIANVLVVPGQHVRHNDPLVEFGE